jgi:hypothetical protein
MHLDKIIITIINRLQTIWVYNLPPTFSIICALDQVDLIDKKKQQLKCS